MHDHFFCETLLKNLFIFGCAVSLLLSGLVSICSECRLLLLQSTRLGTQASAAVARGLSSRGSQALEHRFNSCGAVG